jgi:hypothetical protein
MRGLDCLNSLDVVRINRKYFPYPETGKYG